jgi:phosphopantothenoylcysteine decarboxylase/phosphopantothenate--cysteine ligase
LGAEVHLISGPVALGCPPGVNRIMVESAAEMHQACMQYWPKVEIAVMAAAVADFTPLHSADSKIKKQDGLDSIELLPTADILAAMGKSKKKEQILVGFALETDNEAANARKKLEAKNCDFLVLNSLRDAGAGFGHDTNRVSIFSRSGMVLETDLKSKAEIAAIIAKTVCGLE